MFSTFYPRLAAILSVMLIILVGAQAAFAQGDDRTSTGNIEILGTVEALTLSTITVNGLLVDTSLAEIAAPLALEQAVYVEGTLLPDGTVQARQVRAARAGLQPGELELTGMLESLTRTEVVVNGLSLSVVGAEIKGSPVIGGLVKLHAMLDNAGVWVVREVESYVPAIGDDSGSNDRQDDSPDLLQGRHFKIVGTLQEVGDGFVVVGGQVIDTSVAEVDTLLVVGGLVRIELSLSDGRLIAHEVERARNSFNANDNEDDSPDRSDDNSNDNQNSNSSVAASCVVKAPSGWITYTIRRGDTLSAIARATGSTVGELAATNCLTDTRFIRAGQQVLVPRQPTASFISNNNDNRSGRDNDNWNDNNENEDDDHDDNRNANANDNEDHSNDNEHDNEDDD